jgi:nickel/cobalt transporter (NiCoT) family protein
LNSGFWAWLNDVDFGTLGYGIVALFVLTWTLSYGIWKVRRIEERWTSLIRSR